MVIVYNISTSIWSYAEFKKTIRFGDTEALMTSILANITCSEFIQLSQQRKDEIRKTTSHQIVLLKNNWAEHGPMILKTKKNISQIGENQNLGYLFPSLQFKLYLTLTNFNKERESFLGLPPL